MRYQVTQSQSEPPNHADFVMMQVFVRNGMQNVQRVDVNVWRISDRILYDDDDECIRNAVTPRFEVACVLCLLLARHQVPPTSSFQPQLR